MPPPPPPPPPSSPPAPPPPPPLLPPLAPVGRCKFTHDSPRLVQNLELLCDKPPSNFDFIFNLRRYTAALGLQVHRVLAAAGLGREVLDILRDLLPDLPVPTLRLICLVL